MPKSLAIIAKNAFDFLFCPVNIVLKYFTVLGKPSADSYFLPKIRRGLKNLYCQNKLLIVIVLNISNFVYLILGWIQQASASIATELVDFLLPQKFGAP